MEQEKKRKLCLGAGIAGLIWCYYNKDYICIGDNIGGQFNNYFSLGARYLHDNEYSRQFLKDIGVPIEPIRVKTGYQTKDGFFVDIMLNKKYKQQYYMKSRGINNLDGFDETAMSEGKNNFLALKVDFNKIIEKLVVALEGRIIVGKASMIDAEHKVVYIEGGVSMEYDKLVSSIPAGIFSKILLSSYGQNFPASENFKNQHVTFILLKPEINPGFDYVYVAQKNIPHHRLNFTDKGLVAEWLGIHNEEECKEHYKDKYVDSKVLYGSQIIPFKWEHNLKDVIFIGRFGTWDRHWKTEMVIEIAQKMSGKILESSNG